MKLLVVLSSVMACAMAQVLVYNSLPYGLAHPYSYAYSAPVVSAPFINSISSQFRAQDELGQFSFATAGDNQARSEIGTLDGAVRGGYSYVDANGKLINVLYQADDQGFRVLGANNLPEAPSVPAAPALVGPEPVKDTPEVVAAKAVFNKQYAEAASAAAASPDTTVSRKKRALLYPAVSPFGLAAKIESVPADTKKVEIAPFPLTYAVPQVVAPLSKTTFKYQQFEPVEAPVPADTKKIELKEKEQEVIVPVPITYSVPQVIPAAPQVIAAPHVYAAPALAKTTIKYQQFEPVVAPVPADTKKIELKEKEQEILTPTYPLPLPLFSHANTGVVFA